MPRIAAFLVGLLLAGSLVFWVLRWPARDTGRALPPPLPVASDELPRANPGRVAMLLGAPAAQAESTAAPDAASRFRLTGIIASDFGQGVALVAIDGKPPRPYRVGSQLEEGLMLQSVQQRRIFLAADAKAPVRLQLDLPPRQP